MNKYSRLYLRELHKTGTIGGMVDTAIHAVPQAMQKLKTLALSNPIGATSALPDHASSLSGFSHNILAEFRKRNGSNFSANNIKDKVNMEKMLVVQ